MVGQEVSLRSTATGGDELASSESNAVTVAEAYKGGKEEGSSEPGKGVKDKQDEISV